MARSLELTPPGAKDLDFAIRTSINLWGQQFNTVRRSWLDTVGRSWIDPQDNANEVADQSRMA